MGLWSFGRDSDIGFITRVVSAIAADGVKLRGKLTIHFRGVRPRGAADAAGDTCAEIAAQVIAESHDHRRLVSDEAGVVNRIKHRLPEEFPPCRSIELVALHVVGEGSTTGPRQAGGPPAPAAQPRAAAAPPERADRPVPAPPQPRVDRPEAAAPAAPSRERERAPLHARDERVARPAVSEERAPRIQDADRFDRSASPRVPADPRDHQERAGPSAPQQVRVTTGPGPTPRFSLPIPVAVLSGAAGRRRSMPRISLPSQPAAKITTKRRSDPAQSLARNAAAERQEREATQRPERVERDSQRPERDARRPDRHPLPRQDRHTPPRPERQPLPRQDRDTPHRQRRESPPATERTGRAEPAGKRATPAPARRPPSNRAARAASRRSAAWVGAIASLPEGASLEAVQGPVGAMLRDGAARLALMLLLAVDQPSFDLMAVLDHDSAPSDREDVERLGREASACVASLFYEQLMEAGLPQNLAIDALQYTGGALPGGGLPIAEITRYLSVDDPGAELAKVAATVLEARDDATRLAEMLSPLVDDLCTRLCEAAALVTRSAGL
jgi:hypothetical protein